MHASTNPCSSDLAQTPASAGEITPTVVYGVLVLIFATVFGAVDRQILALMAEPLRKAMSLSDTELGLIKGVAFTLFSGVAAFPIGWLADRFGRRLVLGLCVLVWSACTAACGLTESFGGLFIAAAGMGIGEAGITPVVYGLLPQIVPPSRRILVNGIYSLAALLGAGLGITLGGVLMQHLEEIRTGLPDIFHQLDAWRLAFILTGAPGPLVVALIVFIRVRKTEQPRVGREHPAVSHAMTIRGYLNLHWRTAVGIFGGLGLATMGLHASIGWVPVIATRTFGEPSALVGKGIGMAYLIGTVLGAAFGWCGVRYFGHRIGRQMPIRINTLGMLAAATTALGYLFVSGAQQLYVLVGIQVSAVIAGTVLIPTILQDITPPGLRSRLIGLGGILGLSLSALAPVLVGAMSDRMTHLAMGLPIAMCVVCTSGLFLAALLMHATRRFYARTVSEMEALEVASP